MMGVSTDGQICFGISFGEDFEFPWDAYEDLVLLHPYLILVIHMYNAYFLLLDSSLTGL